MPPWCPPIPSHPARKASSALPAPHVSQATAGTPQPPAELRKHLCPRATIFIEVLNPTGGGGGGEGNGGQQALAQSKGQNPK